MSEERVCSECHFAGAIVFDDECCSDVCEECGSVQSQTKVVHHVHKVNEVTGTFVSSVDVGLSENARKSARGAASQHLAANMTLIRATDAVRNIAGSLGIDGRGSVVSEALRLYRNYSKIQKHGFTRTHVA
eukprot:700057_1